MITIDEQLDIWYVDCEQCREVHQQATPNTPTLVFQGMGHLERDIVRYFIAEARPFNVVIRGD